MLPNGVTKVTNSAKCFSVARETQVEMLDAVEENKDRYYTDWQMATKTADDGLIEAIRCAPHLLVYKTYSQYQAFRLAGENAEEASTELQFVDFMFFCAILNDPQLFANYRQFTTKEKAAAMVAFTAGVCKAWWTRHVAGIERRHCEALKQLANERASRDFEE